jgi:transaldolase
MKYFLDSGKIDEIRYAYDNYKIDGVTTNPKHIMDSGKPFLTVINELAEEFRGKEFPISVEINPHLIKAEDMIQAAKELSPISDNFVIKVPCNEQGLTAAKKLEEQQVRTNVTLVFTASQALQAGRIGAKYVDSFANFGFQTEIIAAAIRNGNQLATYAAMGAHIATAGLAVYKDSFEHPFTDKGLKIFGDAWDQTEGN